MATDDACSLELLVCLGLFFRSKMFGGGGRPAPPHRFILQNYVYLNIPQVSKSHKNLMTSSVVRFNEKKFCKKLNTSHTVNPQGPILQRCLNDNFE